MLIYICFNNSSVKLCIQQFFFKERKSCDTYLFHLFATFVCYSVCCLYNLVLNSWRVVLIVLGVTETIIALQCLYIGHNAKLML